MKTALLSILFLALAATGAEATTGEPPAGAVAPKTEVAPPVLGWAGLQSAMTTAQAAAILGPKCGAPLIVSRRKGSPYETWNYDRGGDLLFENGALVYWTVPRDQRAEVEQSRAAHLADRQPPENGSDSPKA